MASRHQTHRELMTGCDRAGFSLFLRYKSSAICLMTDSTDPGIANSNVYGCTDDNHGDQPVLPDISSSSCSFTSYIQYTTVHHR